MEDEAKKEGQYKESFIAPDAKVLVVDDNEMNLAVVKAFLKNTKIQITTCMSGMECLEVVTKESFDVILLDHMMPEMDGIETLDRLKQSENQCQSTPVLALTANAIEGAKEEYIKAGFSDYLSKPIGGADLEKMLLKYIPADKVHIQKEDDCPNDDSIPLETCDTEPLINTELGLQYCAGSNDFYKEMLELFCNSYDERVANISKALQSEDWKTYTVYVHGLKSTSLNIGGEKISAAAKELEEAGKRIQKSDNDEDKEFIRKHQETVMNLYQKTVLEAQKICDNSSEQ